VGLVAKLFPLYCTHRAKKKLLAQGTFLLEAARCVGTPHFRGWGIDISAEMCETLKERAFEAGLADRITIVQADVRKLKEIFPEEERQLVECVHGGSIFNEFFHNGTEQVVELLKDIKELFPQAPVLISDYYGMLGHDDVIDDEAALHTLLHDLLQTISGQGIPPPDRKGWEALYELAGYRLELSDEYFSNIKAFFHVIRPKQ